MPHSSSSLSNITVTNATMNYTTSSTILTSSSSSNNRFPVATPPPSSGSPIELAPILLVDSVENRPPSPDSPRLKKRFMENPLPAYLEPRPLFIEMNTAFSLCLFSSSQPLFASIIKNEPEEKTIPELIIPSFESSRRSSSSTTSSSRQMFEMSPTMAAASASAAASADQRHPGSQIASNESAFYNKKKSVNVDQSMFLTKNAHIKRPRNAWIHFRCHYGQALKAQDPTLRAEEISKRASRRWGKLSENEKRPWHGLAEQEKLAHREAFPEYRYCPRRATTSTTSPPPSIAVAANARPRANTMDYDSSFIPSQFRPQKKVKRNSK